MVMREITISTNFIFIGHGYLEQTGGGWKENNSLRYHVYFTPIRTTCQTQVDSCMAVVWVWMHSMSLKLQQVFRKGNN